MRGTVSLVLLSLVCAPVFAQHLGEREQWQPQVMPADPRLDQPVEIEITGRAAVPALEMLSGETGVSFGVAPEDLDALGERKLTIIAKGLPLMAIMVQLPEALQEAHWDVATHGGEPVYRLHRNSGIEHTMDWLTQRDEHRRADHKRCQRVARMELARRALQMSPEELAQLEETDPLLARSVRDPHSRDLVEILVTLPSDQAAQLRETGRVNVPFREAPERLRNAMTRIADRWHPDPEPGRILEGAADEIRHWREDPSHTFISFEDWGVEHGFGIRVNLNIPTRQGIQRGFNTGIRDAALFPKYYSLDDGESRVARLLMATGVPDKETAFEMATQRDKEGFRADAEKSEERRAREWREPTDPDLLQAIVIGDRRFADFAELQAFIAEETGISVVSDYFTLRLGRPYISDEQRQGIPLWRLLHLVGEHRHYSEDVYLWEKAGSCLVFHRADWPVLAKAEIPEWLIADYRSRVEAQGELTLDDVAELAMTLESRDLSARGLPRDLRRAAIGADTERWALLLYASLTREQKEKLVGPMGLVFADMTLAQQRAVRDRAANRPVAVPAGSVADAFLRLASSAREAHGRTLEITELQLHFGEFVDSAMVGVKVQEKEQATGDSQSR